MRRSWVTWLAVGVVVAGVVGVVWAQCGGMGAAGCGMMAAHKTDGGAPPGSAMAQSLGKLEAALEAARKSAEAGDAKAAAAELVKAQELLAGLKAGLKGCPMMAEAGKPVNATCPIMGGKIDPSAVKGDLTRQFNGQTVAFCCGGCPAQWDKLTHEQKQAKLAQHKAAEAKPAEAKPAPHAGH